MESTHLPLLVRISGSSANEPTQTAPKLPELAMIRFALGGARTPETETTWGAAGSLLATMIVPAFGPYGADG